MDFNRLLILPFFDLIFAGLRSDCRVSGYVCFCVTQRFQLFLLNCVFELTRFSLNSRCHVERQYLLYQTLFER